eukprot:TRINITY_DN27382_c0_g1_i1.p1 TRINITY_DN27382_c0_g1~~TRINITY_DN27382_c0_g1_i1.p1  ORF type:complete len:1495 (+),score=483.06 TRINITY_DN27382_c0_g1_i1:50-4534(+)
MSESSGGGGGGGGTGNYLSVEKTASGNSSGTAMTVSRMASAVGVRPTQKEGQIGPNDPRRWGMLKGARHMLGVMKRHREQSDEFIATVSHIRRHGISAVALLSLFSEELFDVFQRAWRAECGSQRCVGPVDFLQLLRGFFQTCGGSYFDRHGMFVNRGGEPSRTRPGGLSDLDNYAKELFVSVDTARHGVICWDDFVSFIIDGVAKDAGAGNVAGKRGQQAATPYGKGGFPEMSYTLSRQVFETTQKKASPVAWLRYYRPWHRVAAIAKRRFFLADLTDLDLYDQPKWIRSFESDVDLLSAAFSQTWKAVILASSDFRLRTWDPIQNQIVNEFNLAHSATALSCSPSGKLYVGDRQGSFTAYDFDKFMRDNTLSTPPILGSLDLHENTVTDILTVDDAVITVGLDSRMYSIRPDKGYQAVAYEHATKNAHKHGIFTVCHAESYKFLITTGIEPYALIWVDNMPSIPSFKLSDPNSPHASPLVGACTIAGTPNVITADVSGVTKVFDIRNCRILESFNIKSQLSKHDTQLFSVAHTGNRTRQLLFGSTSVFVFEHESRTSDIPKMAHSPEHPLLGACFMAAERIFMTWTCKEVRVWSQFTGILEKTITNLTTSAITVLMPDDRTPGRIVIGHQDGAVTVHEVASLKLLRTYRKHLAPITHIVIGVHTGLLFTCASDGSMLVWMDLDHPLLLRGTLTGKGTFNTFTDEVLRSQDHANNASEALIFNRQPSKRVGETGERSGAVLSAVEKLKGKIALQQMDEKFKQQQRNDSGGGKGEERARAAARRARQLPTNSKNVVTEPMMKLNVHYEIIQTAISDSGQWLLLVFPYRLATVYSIDFSEAVGRYQLVVHSKLGHSVDTELVGGRFVCRQDFVITNDISGMVHIWNIESYSVPVCISRFYASYPPKPVSEYGPLSEYVDEGTLDCPTLVRNKDTVKELLNSLKSPSEFHVAEKKSHSVPTISALTWLGTFLYIADELGVVSCWDLSSVINISEMPNIRRAYQQFAETGQNPEGFMDMNIPSVTCTWTAHTDGICEMTCMRGVRNDDGSQMVGLVTCGMDAKVGCWAMDGADMGWLRQGPNIKKEWSLSQEKAFAGLRRVRTLNLWKKLKAVVIEGRARTVAGGDIRTDQPRSTTAWQRWREVLNLLRQASVRCAVEAQEMTSQAHCVAKEAPRFQKELSPRHKVLAPVVANKQRGQHAATTQAFKDIQAAVHEEELRKEEEAKNTNKTRQHKQQLEAILRGDAVARDRRIDLVKELALEHDGVAASPRRGSPSEVPSSPPLSPPPRPLMRPVKAAAARKAAGPRPPTLATGCSAAHVGIGHVGEGNEVMRLTLPPGLLPTVEKAAVPPTASPFPPREGAAPDDLEDTTAESFRVGSLFNTSLLNKDVQIGHWSPVKRFVAPLFTPMAGSSTPSPTKVRPHSNAGKVLPLMGVTPMASGRAGMKPRPAPAGPPLGVQGERRMRTAPAGAPTNPASDAPFTAQSHFKQSAKVLPRRR